MFYALLIVHILASVFLVFVVLLQTGRGAELGAAFGGMGQTTFGRGQSTFITKFTTGLAVVFMTTSLLLAFLSSEQPNQSVLAPQPAQQVQQQQPEGESAGSTPEAQTQPTGQGVPAPLEQTKAPPAPATPEKTQ